MDNRSYFNSTKNVCNIMYDSDTKGFSAHPFIPLVQPKN